MGKHWYKCCLKLQIVFPVITGVTSYYVHVMQECTKWSASLAFYNFFLVLKFTNFSTVYECFLKYALVIYLGNGKELLCFRLEMQSILSNSQSQKMCPITQKFWEVGREPKGTCETH